MAFAPPLFIDTRAMAPRQRFGLLDAADEVVPEDPRRFMNGIEYHTNCRMNAALNTQECGEAWEFELGDPADGRPTATVAPIRVFAGFTCRSVGLTPDQMNTEAQNALAIGAPVVLEQFLWTPAAAPVANEPDQLHLMGPETVVLSGAAVSVVAGIRKLEDYLAGEYGRQGVIHAPAGVSADLGFYQQVRWDNGKPVTQRGTRYSWGAYPYADPEGAAAAAGTAWLVATGAVTLRQSSARVLGDYQQSLDRATNEVFAIATKTYVVAWECVTAAVLVNLES